MGVSVEELKSSLLHHPGDPARESGLKGRYSVTGGPVAQVFLEGIRVVDSSVKGSEERLLHFFSMVLHERDHIELLLSREGIRHYLKAEASLIGRKVEVGPSTRLELAPLASHYRALTSSNFYDEEISSLAPDEVRILRKTADRSQGDKLVEAARESTRGHREAIDEILSLVKLIVSKGRSTDEALQVVPLIYYASTLSGRPWADLVRVNLEGLSPDFFNLEESLSLLENNKWLPRRAEFFKDALKELLNSSNFFEMIEVIEGLDLPVIVVDGNLEKRVLSFNRQLLSFYPDKLASMGVSRCDLKKWCPLNCDGRLSRCPLRREWGFPSLRP